MARDVRRESGDSSDGYSRRRLLELGGATALTVGLAGCQSGEKGDTSNNGGGGTTGDSTSSGGGGSGGTPKDPKFNSFTGANPTNSHYNYYNPAQYGGMNNLLYNMLWRYNWRTGEYHSRIGTNYEVDGKTATFEVDTNYKWADGKSVTATDVKKQLMLEKFVEDPIWNFIEGVSTSGEATIELKLKEAYNPDVFRSVLGQGRYIVVKRGSEYDDWLKKFKDAGSEEKRKKVLEEFTTWTYAKDSDDPVSNGPFKVKSHTSSKWTLERNEHFPFKTNIQNFVLTQSSSDQDTWQRMTSDKLDGAGIIAVPASIQKQLPDHMQQLTLPAGGTYAPMFNFDTVWGTRAARQAFTYLMDRKLVDKNINPRHQPLPNVTGLTSDLSNKVLGKDFVDNTLTNYGVESKPDKAAQVLKNAGFSKEGNRWKTPDGNTLSLEWIGPSFPGSTGFAETLGQLLPQFGIEYKKTILSPPQWISRRQEGKYDLSFNYIGGGPHPYFFLSAIISSDRSQYGNWPRDQTKVPPVGKPDGQDQQFDIAQVLQDITLAKDDDALAEATKRYSWYLNQQLPVTQLTEAAWPTYVTTDDWSVPSKDADVMGIRSPYHQLLRESEGDSNKAILQAKTK